MDCGVAADGCLVCAVGWDATAERAQDGSSSANAGTTFNTAQVAINVAGCNKQIRYIWKDGAWIVDATLPLAEFKPILGITAHLPNESEAEFRTAGGFVVTQFGRIPAVGDKFDWGGWRFEVAERSSSHG